jgi:hypothetical protein
MTFNEMAKHYRKMMMIVAICNFERNEERKKERKKDSNKNTERHLNKKLLP